MYFICISIYTFYIPTLCIKAKALYDPPNTASVQLKLLFLSGKIRHYVDVMAHVYDWLAHYLVQV